MDATNLVLSAVQSVCLITNVTSGNNSPMRSEPIPCPAGMIGCLVYHSKLVPTGEPPTEKWVATNVVAEFRLSFDWMGQNREVKHSVPVWGVTNHYKLKQEWEKWDPPQRLSVGDVSWILAGTNVSIYQDFGSSVIVPTMVLTNPAAVH